MRYAALWIGIVSFFCVSVYEVSAGTELGGPRGGRLLGNTSPMAEFYVEQDRTVSIAFYNGDFQPEPVVAQSAKIIVTTDEGKKELELEKRDDLLISTVPLPEGDGHDLVVQIKETADSKPKNYRFKLETHICGSCHRAEYACTCDE